MHTIYIVSSGPDNSHLIDAKVFDRLKDAREYIDDLPLTPNGKDRPYEIYRSVYSGRKTQYPEKNTLIDKRMME